MLMLALLEQARVGSARVGLSEGDEHGAQRQKSRRRSAEIEKGA
jgi:hypothetical protein